jgi:hypothetical protein
MRFLPSCHTDYGDYQGLSNCEQGLSFNGLASTRSSFPEMNQTPLVILSLRLKGIRFVGHPVNMVYHQIAPFYPQEGSSLFDLEFDFGDENGLKAYENNLSNILPSLQGYVFVLPAKMPFFDFLHRFQRFIVFLSTHSTPDEGLLWFAGDGSGAATVEDVSTIFFYPFSPPKLAPSSSFQFYSQKIFSNSFNVIRTPLCS